jgi:hypothetical protein
VARAEFFQQAGAADVVAAAAAAPEINYSKAEQQCIDWAQEKISVNKANNLDKFKMKNKRGKEFTNIGWLVATSYEETGQAHPECQDFFNREKERKAVLKAQRRASRKKRRSRRKPRSRKSSRKSSRKTSARRAARKSPRKSSRKSSRKSPRKTARKSSRKASK